MVVAFSFYSEPSDQLLVVPAAQRTVRDRMAAVGGAAPAAAAAAQSTETEWTTFLDQLRDQAEIDDFIENLGQDLVGSEILREAEFGKKPSMLQKSKLKARSPRSMSS